MPIERPAHDEEQTRRRTMELLAKADDATLIAAWEALPDRPEIARVRGPETGLVMLRGRMGGGGSPFNLGEATVSRATIRLSTGEIGHGQTLGLSRRKAELAAIFDALAQRPEHARRVGELLDAIEADIAANDGLRERQTAATKVDFFTMSPVFQSQSVFKALMDGMARPGTIQPIAAGAEPPPPMGAGSGAIALTLCDHDTPVNLAMPLVEAGVPG
eukprot:gene13082-17403_t